MEPLLNLSARVDLRWLVDENGQFVSSVCGDAGQELLPIGVGLGGV